MATRNSFADIHCHLLPGIDDGAKTWQETLTMAELAANDGTAAVIVTPHQLGQFQHNTGNVIRQLTAKTQQLLQEQNVDLQIVAGGDVRIEDNMFDKIRTGEVLTLGDRGKHILLELPHELYFPLEPVLDQLARMGITGVLSHPERNQGILAQPKIAAQLVDYGCLMQVTAGSVCGSFGNVPQRCSEWMLAAGLAHFIATDAHGPKSRRPLMARAHQRCAELTNPQYAAEVCSQNPWCVVNGGDVAAGRRKVSGKRSLFKRWSNVA